MAQIKKKEHKRVKPQRGHVCRQCRVIALIMFQFIRYYLDLFVDFLFGLYYNSRVQRVPPPSDPLVLESATSLALKIKKRQLTSEKVVRTFIDRIHQVNSLINAVVDERFVEAIEEAQNIDKDIAAGIITDDDFKKKPFLGIPFTTKETTAAKGLANSFGLVSRKDSKSDFDAEVVRKLKNAGGILIAVTNIPQLNMWQESHNPVYGTTNNPYNTTRTVGGSSGGEASVIAACGSPIGIGSDIGGSLRIPAFMCGVFAHKPSSNLISTHGLTFRTGEEKGTMVVPGPITKYSEDIVPFLKVLLGENTSKLKLDEPVNVKDIKIYYVLDPKDPMVSPIRDEMNKVLLKTVQHFTEIAEQQPKLVNIEELKYGGKIWRYWLFAEPNANFKRDLANRKGELSVPVELLKFCIRISEFNMAVMLLLVNGLLPQVKADWAKGVTDTLHNKLTEILGTNGVLIFPSAPWPASYHHTALLRPWNLNLFAVWNALKFPVTQVPLGLSKEGLPLGVQVVAAPFQDHLAIAVAKELEKAFGGYVPPFKTEK